MGNWNRWVQNPKGYVYFTRFWDVSGEPFVKIGRSVQALPQRMYSVAYDSWLFRRVLLVDWESMGVIAGSFADERAIQTRFQACVVLRVRCNGVVGKTEFFHDTPEIRRFARRRCTTLPDESCRPNPKFVRWRDEILAELGPRAALCGWARLQANADEQRRLPIGAAVFL